MTEEYLVNVENVSKKFSKNLNLSLLYGLQDLGANFFGNDKERKLRKSEFWAVDDITFKLKRGESLALIGHNGAGKSTLLKILAGLISPDRGRIEMRGRVNALIELGSGFNPILTGRENIYNNAAILGFSREQIRNKLHEIIEFSELEEFIDTPVRYYSSGMKVKLGFSVAAHLEPDILILDEVLAVGDAGFRIKSFNKTMELMKNCAVLFVSHSMPNVARLCNKVMFMHHGKEYYFGDDVNKGIEMYFEEFQSEIANIETEVGGRIKNWRINGIVVEPSSKASDLPSVHYGSTLEIEFDAEITDKSAKNFYVAVQITDKDLKIVAVHFTNKFASEFQITDENRIKISIPNIQLIDGEYALTYFLATQEGLSKKDYRYLAIYRNYTKFKVRGLNDTTYASFYLKGDVYHNNCKLETK